MVDRSSDPPVSPELHHMDMMLSYADCDPAQIIYFAAWFPWMERVQSEWMHRHGMRQDSLIDRFGFSTVTRAAECEYLARASLFDRVRISLHAGRIGVSSAQSEMRMVRLDDHTVVARGSITVVTIDDDGAVVRIPEVLRRLYRGEHTGARGVPPDSGPGALG